MTMKRGMIGGVLAVLITVLTASAALAGEVRLSVAASLREVIGELADGFARQHPGVSIQRNFGGSGTLAKQIENGAPADLFISANEEWLDYLKTRKLIDDSSIGTFAYNTLVFAGSGARRAGGMGDLVRLERIAIGSPKSVPAGEYAMEALRRAGIAGELQGKLVMAKDVREALLYAERGEVDGAFVYRTDAQLLGHRAKVLFVVPQALYPRVTYPMALTAAGGRNAEARAFLAYLGSAGAKNVLAKYGFALK